MLIGLLALTACETTHVIPEEGPDGIGIAASRRSSRTAKVPNLGISASSSQITAGNSASFVVSLSKANGTPTTVNYSVGGTALLGPQYNLNPASGNLIIPVGMTSATVTLTSVAGAAPAGTSKTATVTLRSGTGYKVSSTQSKATITLKYSAPSPTPTPTPVPTPTPTPAPTPTPTPTPAPTPTPSPSSTPIAQTDVYIAVRTDGLPGIGAQTDPYDGSTAAKFDAIMNRVQWTLNLHIHLLGAGPFRTDVRHTWFLNAGWTLSGDGMNATTVQLQGSLAGLTDGGTVLFNSPNYVCNDVTIQDLTVDCNWPELGSTADNGSSGEKNTKLSAVIMWGSNNLVQRVRTINSYGSWGNLKEQFVIRLVAPRNGEGTNNVIDSCRAESPFGTYGSPYSLAGWIDDGPTQLITNSKVINCTAVGLQDGNHDGFTTGGVNLGNVKDCVIDGNTFIDCTSVAYGDTGSVDGLWITNNHLTRGALGVGMCTGGRPKQNIHVLNNELNIQNRYPNGASYGVAFDFGASNNITIDGNTITFDATGNGYHEFLAIESAGMDTANISNNVVGTAPYPVSNRVQGTNLTFSNNQLTNGSPAPGLQ